MTDLEKTRTKLEEGLERMKDVNTQFPATRAFLETRGLKSVRELGRKGVEELTEYLKKVLDFSTNSKLSGPAH